MDNQNRRAAPSAASIEGLMEELERIAQSWDGCEYDAPGEMMDIGASLRRAFSRLAIQSAKQPEFSEADIPADAPRAFAKRYSALLGERTALQARVAELEAAQSAKQGAQPAPSTEQATPLADLWMHDDMDRDAAASAVNAQRKDLKATHKQAVDDVIYWRRRALTAEIVSAGAAAKTDHASDYDMHDRDLARRIMVFMGRATSGSNEPGADPLADKLAEKLAGWRAAGAGSAQPRDVCAEMRALCSSCGGTGDVTSIDGEWRGECNCPHGFELKLERLKIAAARAQRENEELRAALNQQAGAAAPSQGAQTATTANASFSGWLAREMPAGTVIGDPAWWAPRILHAALARAPLPAHPVQDGEKDAKGGAA